MLNFQLHCINVKNKNITLKNKFYTCIIDFEKSDLIKNLNKYKKQKWFNDVVFKSFFDSYNLGVEKLVEFNERILDANIFLRTVYLVEVKNEV